MLEKNTYKLPKQDEVGYSEIVSIDVAILFCDLKSFTKIVDTTTDPKIMQGLS